jgi:hypothetical protein
MAVLTRTHTKTYALMDAWASTLPWTCDTAGHTHSPMADQPCAIKDCHEPLKANEQCYYVTQLDRDEQGNEQAVCWRHVHPDDGPIRPHSA